MRISAVLLLTALSAALLSGCAQDDPAAGSSGSDRASGDASGQCTYTPTGDAARKVDLRAAGQEGGGKRREQEDGRDAHGQDRTGRSRTAGRPIAGPSVG